MCSNKYNAVRACSMWIAKHLSNNITSRRGLSSMHSVKTIVQGHAMAVHILPALQDNFMYLIVDNETKEAAIVDPVNPAIVASEVDSAEVNLTKILTTHHHWDHAGGNKNMCEKFEGIKILGGDDRIESINDRVSHGDKFNIGKLKVQCLSTPCHTKGHICYLVTGEGEGVASVFTGDTLFVGGCGRFFEGTPEQMHKALNEVLGSLPDQTRVYCGHEYTCKNLQFGLTVEPNNEDIKNKLEWASNQRKTQSPTVPSTIEDEKKTNPFMRVHTPSVMNYTATNDPISTMGSLRREKDDF